MNKKGFTLIEVLAVITLLGVMSAIAVPSIYTISKKHKENLKEKQLNNILNIASLYFQDNYDEFSDCLKNDNKCTIEINKLVDKNYLTNEDIIDPTNNSKLNNTISISESDDCSGNVVNIYDENEKEDITYCLEILEMEE